MKLSSNCLPFSDIIRLSLWWNNNCYSRTWVDADKVDAVCGESYQCKYDYSTSLNMEFALFTKYYQDQFINIREGVLKPEARGNENQVNSWQQ